MSLIGPTLSIQQKRFSQTPQICSLCCGLSVALLDDIRDRHRGLRLDRSAFTGFEMYGDRLSETGKSQFLFIEISASCIMDHAQLAGGRRKERCARMVLR